MYIFNNFEERLLLELKKCYFKHESIRMQQMEMWHLYHQLHTSALFCSAWQEFWDISSLILSHAFTKKLLIWCLKT